METDLANSVQSEHLPLVLAQSLARPVHVVRSRIFILELVFSVLLESSPMAALVSLVKEIPSAQTVDLVSATTVDLEPRPILSTRVVSSAPLERCPLVTELVCLVLLELSPLELEAPVVLHVLAVLLLLEVLHALPVTEVSSLFVEMLATLALQPSTLSLEPVNATPAVLEPSQTLPRLVV